MPSFPASKGATLRLPLTAANLAEQIAAFRADGSPAFGWSLPTKGLRAFASSLEADRDLDLQLSPARN